MPLPHTFRRASGDQNAELIPLHHTPRQRNNGVDERAFPFEVEQVSPVRTPNEDPSGTFSFPRPLGEASHRYEAVRFQFRNPFQSSPHPEVDHYTSHHASLASGFSTQDDAGLSGSVAIASVSSCAF